jgi:hypothetical protein
MANKSLAPDQAYAGRSAKIALVQIWMDRKALAHVKAQAIGPNATSRYIERLVFQDMARLEERTRLTRAQTDD